MSICSCFKTLELKHWTDHFPNWIYLIKQIQMLFGNLSVIFKKIQPPQFYPNYLPKCKFRIRAPSDPLAKQMQKLSEKGKGYNDSYTQTGSRAAREETPPGCKRESIMRICVEKKGIVPRCIFQNSWVTQGWNSTNHFLKLEWSNWSCTILIFEAS